MLMRPVCIKCGLEMFPACNEVAVWHPIEPITLNPDSKAIDDIDFVVSGDRWECPKCHASIVTGFGNIQTGNDRTQEWLRQFRDEKEEQIRILRGVVQ